MPLRILIADDNLVFRTALRQLLQSVDHWDTIEVKDGQEAVAKAAETLPDLIVLDLAMPAKDGLAAAREISQMLPNTPIIMCTMHMSAQVEGEAMKSGIRKVLSKSDSTLLVETIRQFLLAREATSASPAPKPLPVLEAPADQPTSPATTTPDIPKEPNNAA